VDRSLELCLWSGVYCSCIECAGVNAWMVVEVVVGGIYSPNHQFNRWGRLLSMGAPDSPVRHRTVRCATEHCPVRQPRHPTVRVLTVSNVGALTSWGIGQSGAAPDRHCSLSGAPSGACSVTPGFRRQTECELCTCQDQNSRTQRLHK
jgi:hypothetical protein